MQHCLSPCRWICSYAGAYHDSCAYMEVHLCLLCPHVATSCAHLPGSAASVLAAAPRLITQSLLGVQRRHAQKTCCSVYCLLLELGGLLEHAYQLIRQTMGLTA